MGSDAERKPRRTRRSLAEKQRIVALTEVAGASVARVAGENGVNANQVYGWKRLKRQGRLGAAAESGALIAVRLAAEPEPKPRTSPSGGGLELQHGRGRLRVENGADPVLLRIVLEHLIG